MQAPEASEPELKQKEIEELNLQEASVQQEDLKPEGNREAEHEKIPQVDTDLLRKNEDELE